MQLPLFLIYLFNHYGDAPRPDALGVLIVGYAVEHRELFYESVDKLPVYGKQVDFYVKR